MKLKVLSKLVLFFLILAITLKSLFKYLFQQLRHYFHLKFLVYLFGDQNRVVANFGSSCLNKSLKNVSIVLTAPLETDALIIARRNNKLNKLVHWLGLIGCQSVSIFSPQSSLSHLQVQFEKNGSNLLTEVQILRDNGELFALLQEQKKEFSQMRGYEEVKEYLSKHALLGLSKMNSIPQMILVFDQALNDLNLYGYPCLLREQAQIYAMNKRLEDLKCLDFIQQLKVFSGTEIRLGK